MAAITATITFTTSHPSAKRVRHSLITTYNSAEPGVITLTVPRDYRQLRIMAAFFASTGAATLPAFAEAERCMLRLSRAGTLHGPISSLPRVDVAAGGTAIDAHNWNWLSDELRYFPVIFPADQLLLFFPAIDDDGTPVADVSTQFSFEVIKR